MQDKLLKSPFIDFLGGLIFATLFTALNYFGSVLIYYLASTFALAFLALALLILINFLAFKWFFRIPLFQGMARLLKKDPWSVAAGAEVLLALLAVNIVLDMFSLLVYAFSALPFIDSESSVPLFITLLFLAIIFIGNIALLSTLNSLYAEKSPAFARTLGWGNGIMVILFPVLAYLIVQTTWTRVAQGHFLFW